MTSNEERATGAADSGRRGSGDPPAVDAALAAGRALYDRGHLGAARDPLERARVPLPADATDERLLRGLIGLVDAVDHAQRGDADGARDLAAAARAALAEVPEGHRGIAVEGIREFLNALSATAADSGAVDRTRLPDLAPDAPDPLAEPDLDAVLLAVEPLAETLGGVDPAVVADAVRYAREERGTGRTRYAELLTAFLTEPDQRAPVSARLRDHVERERSKEDDVAGLF